MAAPLAAQGESETLDLKRAGETLCAFLSGEGGKVLIGVGRDGRLVGQEVADIESSFPSHCLARSASATRRTSASGCSCRRSRPRETARIRPSSCRPA